eukprot:CAMPEP_0115027254 /NCGR_PEP_ID=MMETSP0216-20121206/35373_1 /TAXON_ID=223996 /ORGANISM="Protocruzia adherens, Strain Boccale" /LENGTH=39 /DNA_ID= /DNA_START= /DNA_END= /DNA_ORIENTATION=
MRGNGKMMESYSLKKKKRWMRDVHDAESSSNDLIRSNHV